MGENRATLCAMINNNKNTAELDTASNAVDIKTSSSTKEGGERMKSIDLAPTWEFAASIYIEVLQNPDATAGAIIDAKEELLRLARIVDRLKARKEADATSEIIRELSIDIACLLDDVGEIYNENLAADLSEDVKHLRDLIERLKAEQEAEA